ncbi:PREDICTED: A-kinase anchor protein C18orf42 homolog [Ceratotherium simum simum]|uniref:A-kinase anchor protein C18orf42 homolog n=1 Tax=Ceratotherium simum simum TaxID=73337 RepID=A0ABM1C775_CERSS|nr:PREDICTED: A-kinase anchor protein C18orf42 homolog [Ceratotherium simum simum]
MVFAPGCSLLRRHWRLQSFLELPVKDLDLFVAVYGYKLAKSQICLRLTGSPTCEKPGNEPEEVRLQNASKQIVQNAILQAVQQVSRESRRREERGSGNQGTFQLRVGELTKKHEKK